MEKYDNEVGTGKDSKRSGLICKGTNQSKNLLLNRTTMRTVIETLGEYKEYLEYDKGCKPETMRSIDASLRAFCDLFGNTGTSDLKASDFKLFFDLLRRKKRKRKNSEGEHSVV